VAVSPRGQDTQITVTEDRAMADRTDTFYAAAAAVHGYGFQLKVGNGASPQVFQAIAAVKTASPGEASTEDIDRTHGRSPGAHKEHMPGMRDSGVWECEGIYLPDDESHTTAGGGSGSFTGGGLPAIWASREERDFELTLNNGSPETAWEFRGYVSKFQILEIGVDDVVRFSLGIQPTEAFELP
jgi:hypothetical protein